jgi:hypothetical protein
VAAAAVGGRAAEGAGAEAVSQARVDVYV